ncbi:MAG: hypothetical protein EP343_26505 [Deltaproteobacteria bacterium]|nr:MAG: hypothetical protein EP343_26505 [Deltaproteobacteria bacterium]
MWPRGEQGAGVAGLDLGGGGARARWVAGSDLDPVVERVGLKPAWRTYGRRSQRLSLRLLFLRRGFQRGCVLLSGALVRLLTVGRFTPGSGRSCHPPASDSRTSRKSPPEESLSSQDRLPERVPRTASTSYFHS